MNASRIFESIHSLGRYGLVGAGVYAIDMSVFLLLAVGLGLDDRIAQAVSRLSGATAGFFGHRHFTFASGPGEHSLSLAGQGAAYAMVAGLNVAVSPFLVHWAVGVLGGRLVLGKLMGDAIILGYTYLLLRLTFRRRSQTV